MKTDPIIGTRVRLNECYQNIDYITRRSWYTNMYTGKTGTIIGTASTGKIAVEFDDVVFTPMPSTEYNIRSSHDNGCHGRGKDHYCWYIPSYCLDNIDEQDLLLLLC